MKIKHNGIEASLEQDEAMVRKYHGGFILASILVLSAIVLPAKANGQWDNSTIDEFWVQSEFTSDHLGTGNNAFFLGYDLDAMAQFTSKHEGFRSCAYQDLGGGWSVGYGTPSYKDECISKETAYNRLKYRLDVASKIVHGYTGVIPQKDMTALADTVYNVRPRNYDYILKQYHKPNRKKELTYALSRMTMACNDGECVVYGGLKKRFQDRLNLLF